MRRGASAARRWNRRERERAAKKLMSVAFMEIRHLAQAAKGKDDPADALEQIRLLADACHNLPGVIGRRPPAPGDIDPFVRPWRNPREHGWMAGVLQSTGLDTDWLDAAPWVPLVVSPTERPRLGHGGIRVPRSIREYTTVGTVTLRALVNEAIEAVSPPEARRAYLRSLLAHADPEARHLLRPVRPGEGRPWQRNGVSEFRCLMRMNDHASIAFRLALPGKALTALPGGISPVRRFWLAASIPQRHE